MGGSSCIIVCWQFVPEQRGGNVPSRNDRSRAARSGLHPGSRSRNELAVPTKDLVESKQGLGIDSELPVFVVGMPRSGTTLVEQILASHPQSGQKPRG